MLLTQLSLSHSINMVGIQFWGIAENQSIHLLSLHCRVVSCLSGFVLSDDTVNFKSVVGVKPGDSGVVIQYQDVEYTGT